MSQPPNVEYGKAALGPSQPAAAGVLTPRRRAGPLPALVRACSWTYLAAALGSWFLLYLSDLWWPATLFLFSPRWLLAVPLLVLVPAAFVWRRRALLLLVATALVIAGPVMGFNVPWPRVVGSIPDGPRLRVMTCNMHYQRKLDPARLDAFVSATRPDVVALQEWSEGNRSAVLLHKDWHVHRDWRSFLASRYPIRKVRDLGTYSGRKEGSVVYYELQTPAGVVHLFSLHFASPREGLRDAILDSGRGAAEIQSLTRLRWVQSKNLAREAAEVSGPVVLAGDFNTPPQSAIFRQVWSGYTDAFAVAGWGWGYTFLSSRTTVRIDHVLAGSGWTCERCWVGSDVGSPHRPVIADLVRTGRPDDAGR
jgi:vancomycin resistance protein VanJ